VAIPVFGSGDGTAIRIVVIVPDFLTRRRNKENNVRNRRVATTEQTYTPRKESNNVKKYRIFYARDAALSCGVPAAAPPALSLGGVRIVDAAHGRSSEPRRVRRGLEADLVPLDADPLRDNAATRTIHVVHVDGEYLDAARRAQLRGETP
jgi:plasmid stability protein